MDYSKQSRLQICRIDALGAFVEVMADGLPIDKVVLNFVSYDKTKPAASRMQQNVRFYLPVLKAKALAESVFSGHMTKKWVKEMKDSKEAGRKYPNAIFTEMGGVRNAGRQDGKALSRTITLAPGAKKPWVLTAESGPGVPGPNGLLIVPDYGYNKTVKKPENLIRIPMDHEKLEELAAAMDAAFRVWTATRFEPLVRAEMEEKNNKWLAVYGRSVRRGETNEALCDDGDNAGADEPLLAPEDSGLCDDE